MFDMLVTQPIGANRTVHRQHRPNFYSHHSVQLRSWVFWDEQRNPTMGSGGLPRQKTAAPLPEPLPSLTPPEPGAGDDTEDQDGRLQRV